IDLTSRKTETRRKRRTERGEISGHREERPVDRERRDQRTERGEISGQISGQREEIPEDRERRDQWTERGETSGQREERPVDRERRDQWTERGETRGQREERSCNNDYVPVCGSNHHNYQNECFLRRDSCKQQSEVLVMSDGACPAGRWPYLHLTFALPSP
ncbi:hypothetical protein NHX12_006809, partial [Muraenolepis orangiensis]